MKQLKIVGDDSPVLSISLVDILKNIAEGSDYYWSILCLEAVGRPHGVTMLDLEQKINQSDNGYPIKWEDLLNLSSTFDQVIEVLILGDKKESNLKRYDKDFEMYSSCTYVLEMVDSSYWEITSDDDSAIENLSKLDGSVINKFE